ncbi:MAG: hypothetical protein M3Y74_06240 [Chloroflexota bacterium]|nr:hypothetical protein [Chloroflexota bacterium]
MARRIHPLDPLLLAAPLAIAAEVLHGGSVALFFLSGLAIVPLARYIGEATEELAERLGSATGGLLNATFGNATELIVDNYPDQSHAKGSVGIIAP